jgi:hypothetical protein
MAFFKQYGKVNEQIKVEFAYMRVAHDGHHINALVDWVGEFEQFDGRAVFDYERDADAAIVARELRY